MEVKIEITFNPASGDCKVTGPIKNRELFEMGLELGRKVVEQYNRKRIIVPMVSAPAKLEIKLPSIPELLKNGQA